MGQTNQSSKGRGAAQGRRGAKGEASSTKSGRLPRQVTIDGMRWKIRRAKDIAKATGENEPLLGMADRSMLTIWVSSSMSDQEQASTLLHEIIHAIHFGLSEKTVRKLEKGLFPMLWRQGWRPGGREEDE